MPETMSKRRNTSGLDEQRSLPDPETALYYIDHAPTVSTRHEQRMNSATQPQSPDIGSVRIKWQIKALLPIAVVLLNGLLLFLLTSLSWRDPERHVVMFVAGGGAVAICAVLLFVLTYQVQRPMVELQEKMAQVGEGNLLASVSFAKRND